MPKISVSERILLLQILTQKVEVRSGYQLTRKFCVLYSAAFHQF